MAVFDELGDLLARTLDGEALGLGIGAALAGDRVAAERHDHALLGHGPQANGF